MEKLSNKFTHGSCNSVWFQAFPVFLCLDNIASIFNDGKDKEIASGSVKAKPILILKVMHVQCLLMS